MRLALLSPILLVGMAASPAATALNVGVDVLFESEYTTNSGLTEINEINEWIHKPGIAVSAEHEGPKLNLDIDYRFERRLYQQDLHDDTNVGAGSAALVWNALPERLDFVINHVRTESAIRSIVAATPENRQESSETTAGPILKFNPRGDDELQFQYEWGQQTSERSSNDSKTHTSTIRYVSALSPINNLTFEGINRRVLYDNRFAPDLDSNIGQITWQRTSRNTEFSFTGGYNQTERSLGQDDVDGAIVDFTFDWQVLPTTAVTFTGGQDIRDRSTFLDEARFLTDRSLSVSSDLANVFTNTRGGLVISRELRSATTLSFEFTYDQEDYEELLRDTKTTSLALGLTRRLTQQTDLSVRIRKSKQDFTDENEEIDSLSVNIDVNWQAMRRLLISFGIGYEDREADSNLPNRSYDELIATIRFTYAAKE